LQNRKGTIWTGSPALIIVLASLCLSLFAWGIGYKLSLYKASEQSKPSMPAAKLLSQKERSVVRTKLQAQVPKEKMLAISLMAFLTTVFLFSGDTLSVSIPNHVRTAKELHNTPASYSRPPPSHA
jgi:hypothetical protein